MGSLAGSVQHGPARINHLAHRGIEIGHFDPEGGLAIRGLLAGSGQRERQLSGIEYGPAFAILEAKLEPQRVAVVRHGGADVLHGQDDLSELAHWAESGKPPAARHRSSIQTGRAGVVDSAIEPVTCMCQVGVVSFHELMALRPQGGDRFLASGPRYPWRVLYGGQVIAQALGAAAHTVRPDAHIHSLHAYYLRAGSDAEEIEFAVERVRDGRSFAARAVCARQGGKAIVRLLASFHVDEGSEEHPTAVAPDVPAPGELPSGGWTALYDRRYAPIGERARCLAWLRMTDSLGEDAHLQACALAFAADDIFDDAVLALLHPDRPPANDLDDHDWSISTQSLDYSVWFHRPVKADGWRLLDYRCRALANACATVVGDVFDETGLHLATVAQQMLVRRVVVAGHEPVRA